MSTVTKVSTVEYRKNIYKYLDRMPLAITSKGKIVFYVVSTLEGAKKNKEVSTDGNVSTVAMKEEVNKDEQELLREVKLAKAREALKNMPKLSKAPIFCPKHGTSRIGTEYTCGCKIEGWV